MAEVAETALAAQPDDSAEAKLRAEVASMRKEIAAMKRWIPRISGGTGRKVTSRKWMDHEDMEQIVQQGDQYMELRFARATEQTEGEKEYVAKREAILQDWVQKKLLRPYATWLNAATDEAKRAMVHARDVHVCPVSLLPFLFACVGFLRGFCEVSPSIT